MRAVVAAVRCGWSPSLPDVDAKLLAGARVEHRLDMIDRRRPRPWTHAERHEIITEGLLTIVGKCGLLAGYRGEKVCRPVSSLTEARSRLRIGYEVLSDHMRVMRPKPVPGVARSIQMSSIDGQCDTKKGVKIP